MAKSAFILFTWLFALCALANGQAAPQKQSTAKGQLVQLCNEFNLLNDRIRDGQLNKKDAVAKVRQLLEKINSAYHQSGEKDFSQKIFVFPLEGYTAKAIGGKNGSGYVASGYDYFDGNKHGGHPAHDIFITDKNQDCLDDANKKNVAVRSVSKGVVIATETNWQPESPQRGGNYIWVYDPYQNKLFYYAHNSNVFVKPGDKLKPGNKIGEVGRSGANASKKRSPTHLHFMQLSLNDNCYPKPENCYSELVAASK